MGHEMAHTNEKEKDIHWIAGRSLARSIERAGGYQKWVKKHSEEAVGAFPEKVNCLCCMDERVVAQKRNAVYSAGSGILIKDDVEKRKNFIAALKKENIKEITIHEGCGALALYQRLNNLSADQAQADMVEWAKYLSVRLQGEYGGELGVAPADFHVAQTLYYDLTGKFNPANAPTLFPSGFVVSRKYMDKKSALAQAEVGVGIALGDHGFGKRFNKKDTFTVVVVGRNAKEVAKGKKEAKKFARKEVAVQGFAAPVA